jgi:hypothetical protein
MPSIFLDYKFIVLSSDDASDNVMEIIDTEHFPSDIIVLNEDDYYDLGFLVDIEEMHVYVVDQCGRLAYIVVPPWRYLRVKMFRLEYIPGKIRQFLIRYNFIITHNNKDPN